MNQTRILFMGLPASGKTTFIAALWNYVNSVSSERKLRLNTLEDGEHEYLNAMRDAWLNFNRVQRTNNPLGEQVVMNLEKSNGTNIILDIPDFSGEAFKSHFEQRKWSVHFDSIIDQVKGIVLFIDPKDEKIRPNTLSFENAMVAILNDKAAQTTPANQEETIPWSHDFVPSQVRIVELLQFLMYHKLKGRSIKLALVVSAWDVIKGEDEPQEWLLKNVPLLSQFLACNESVFATRIYGISAQGGDYEDAAIADSLYEKLPFDRVQVKDGAHMSNDLTKPIFWITE